MPRDVFELAFRVQCDEITGSCQFLLVRGSIQKFPAYVFLSPGFPTVSEVSEEIRDCSLTTEVFMSFSIAPLACPDGGLRHPVTA